MPKKTTARKKVRPKSPKKTGEATFIRVLMLLFLAGITAGSVYLLKNPEIITALSRGKTISESTMVTLPPRAIKEKMVSVNLYFSDPHSDYLVMESRRVAWRVGDTEDQIRVIIAELIKGPKGNLIQTIPSQVFMRDIKLTGKGLGIINFSRELSHNHPGGSLAEMQTIYSIVNSLLLNIPSLNQIQILVEGNPPETLKGHIDCRSPFKANLSIIETG
ncbi:MAG: GerMN domain-containing protein [Deltaproteobacteria bacterium]|nr:GerMN domain-containing protein [Deltaproteobacteria bacterium]